MNSKLTMIAAAVLLAGCKTTAVTDEYPARIIDPDDASRAALQAAVNTLMNTEVLIAADALTETSNLVIDRRPADTLGNSAAQGRIMDAPLQLHLVSNGTDCFLVDPRNDSRQVLENTSCVAVSAD